VSEVVILCYFRTRLLVKKSSLLKLLLFENMTLEILC
jgi:hypothetical protein